MFRGEKFGSFNNFGSQFPIVHHSPGKCLGCQCRIQGLHDVNNVKATRVSRHATHTGGGGARHARHKTKYRTPQNTTAQLLLEASTASHHGIPIF